MEVRIIIKEIKAKTILGTMKSPDSWFGVKYNMNLYKGCEHRCIYCDSRSECYQIENFDDVLVKINAEEILNKELKGKKVKGIVGTGSMSDPYTPAEAKYGLTRKALSLIAFYNFSVHIVTKSNLVLRDLDILKLINRNYANVAFTITTTDDALAKKIEPLAPSPSERFEAMKELSRAGIRTGVTMMPILPFIEDNKENIESIIKNTTKYGGKYIVPWFGMTLRDRQRSYYYSKLNALFPDLKAKYENIYGNKYMCNVPNNKSLYNFFKEKCAQYGLGSQMKDAYYHEKIEQLKLF